MMCIMSYFRDKLLEAINQKVDTIMTAVADLVAQVATIKADIATLATNNSAALAALAAALAKVGVDDPAVVQAVADLKAVDEQMNSMAAADAAAVPAA